MSSRIHRHSSPSAGQHPFDTFADVDQCHHSASSPARSLFCSRGHRARSARPPTPRRCGRRDVRGHITSSGAVPKTASQLGESHGPRGQRVARSAPPQRSLHIRHGVRARAGRSRRALGRRRGLHPPGPQAPVQRHNETGLGRGRIEDHCVFGPDEPPSSTTVSTSCPRARNGSAADAGRFSSSLIFTRRRLGPRRGQVQRRMRPPP